MSADNGCKGNIMNNEQRQLKQIEERDSTIEQIAECARNRRRNRMRKEEEE